jgi:hypothetical protein
MTSLSALFGVPAHRLPPAEKDGLLLAELNRLTAWHAERCPEYRRALAVLHPRAGAAARLEDVPFLPVGVFKSHRLSSVPAAQVFRELRSSGTTGQARSLVVLDRETAELQARALAHTMQRALGPRRLPMLLLERRTLLRSPEAASARGAGVLGMMSFGREHAFVLDDGDRLDESAVAAFLERHGAAPFLVYGLTFVVWRALARREGPRLDLSSGILVHGGGWKRLHEEAVSRDAFRRALRDASGLARVHDFYGMVEQVGSVYLECPEGRLHAPHFADVVVRDPVTRAALGTGEPGVVEVLSALPRSYPGHAILTEDRGIVHTRDGCACGWRGTAFSILGRVPRAEVRGCSDVGASGGGP